MLTPAISLCLRLNRRYYLNTISTHLWAMGFWNRSGGAPDWRKDEDKLRDELDDGRWSCKTTPSTRDGGRDVECEDQRGNRLFGESKSHSRPVGPNIVDDFADVCNENEAEGVMRSKSGYTSGGREAGEERGIDLREGRDDSRDSSLLARIFKSSR